MNVLLTRQELETILQIPTDTGFETSLTQWVEDHRKDLLTTEGATFANTKTIQGLRALLDRYGVEAEDILAAYSTEVAAEMKHRFGARIGRFVPGSLSSRILRRMSRKPWNEFRARDFSDLGYPLPSVRSCLHWLRGSGEIERIAHGKYRIGGTI
jgi:hypothetical protein